jgi:Ca2+-transporting ATPase
MLVTTVSVSFLTQLALIYVGFMQKIFHTAPLEMGDLGIIVGLVCVSFCLHEGRRWYERRVDREEVWVGSVGELA